MEDPQHKNALHDALVEAALLPSTGPLLARAAFYLRSALLGEDLHEVADAIRAMWDAIARSRASYEPVPGELVRSLARVEEWLRGRMSG